MNLLSKLSSRLTVILAAMMLLTVTSACNVSPAPYEPQLNGRWVYTGNEYGSYTEADNNTIYFSPDGYGTYSCYSNGGYGPWTTFNMSWDAYSNGWGEGNLTMYVAGDVWQYYYELSGGLLYLTPTDYYGVTQVYRRR